jgi:Sec-independent protein translocase protein TatA
MSVASEPESTGPHDPMHYAPRRLRDKPEPRLTPLEDARALRERRLDAVIGRSISPPAPLDPQLENAVYETLRRPIDPKLLGETRALARELERRNSLFGLTGRLVAAIGVSAIIALFFIVMMPARQRDTAASFQTAVQSFTTALSQQQQPPQPQQQPNDDTKKPALAEFQTLLTSDTAQAAEREQSERQSDKLLQQFLQWRQKSAPADNANDTAANNNR